MHFLLATFVAVVVFVVAAATATATATATTTTSAATTLINEASAHNECSCCLGLCLFCGSVYRFVKLLLAGQFIYLFMICTLSHNTHTHADRQAVLTNDSFPCPMNTITNNNNNTEINNKWVRDLHRNVRDIHRYTHTLLYVYVHVNGMRIVTGSKVRD